MVKDRIVWGALWRSKNRLNGECVHLINLNGVPALFSTRHGARVFIEQQYGYIKRRPDLREEPHGWRLPVPVRVKVAPTSTKGAK